ncbi:MAG: hypothetical protein J6S67_20390 [Methanobrevibacter sp.]|nr:hypothetical protein [Clostridia bacterium]MBO7734932.1 hypothetical protein [Methanobrevibacter sp.]
MLHFTTRDIVTRARELADLENSNFITWSENMKLLDESYKKLYQEAINESDKYYLTRCELKDLVVAERREKEVSFYLPENFYQLHSISVKGSGRQILKKARTEDSSSARYDIENNTLVLYGGASSLPLDIAYYPVPKTLTLKNSPVTVSVEGTPLDVNGDMVLSVNDGNAIITNINTGWTKSIDISSISGDVIFGILGLTKFFLVSSNLTGYECNIKTGTVTSNSVFMGKKDGMLYYTSVGWGSSVYPETVSFYNEYDHIVTTRSLAGFDTALPFCFSLDDDLNIYWLKSDIAAPKIIKKDTDGNISDVVTFDLNGMHGSYDLWKCFEIIKGSLFYGAADIFCNGVKLLDHKEFETLIGFNKMDFDTGYGFAVTPLYEEGVMQIHSCFADTELDFPNNFYFSYLAYLLAIAYKQKQNADATLLIQRANDEYAQFLTSITRDVAENNRIQNVYGGGTYYYG